MRVIRAHLHWQTGKNQAKVDEIRRFPRQLANAKERCTPNPNPVLAVRDVSLFDWSRRRTPLT
jgi:hypothetical protein